MELAAWPVPRTLMQQLRPIPIADLSGGENTTTSPYLLRPNQSQQVVNFILDEHGSLRVRDGTLTQGVISPRPDRPIRKLYDFVNTAGTVRKLAVLLGTFGNNSLYIHDTSPWTLIGDFSSSYDIPDALTFTDLAILSGGQSEVLRSYDGTSFVALTGAPNGCHIATHFNYLWVGNTNPTTTASAGPSSLQSSDLNNPNSWPGANQTFISKDDGQSIQALSLFTIAEAGISPTATIIVWKDFTGYECTGVLGTMTFSVQKIKSDMGCVAPRSVQFMSGFGLVRLTHRGFALYDGVNDTLISEEERPRIFGRDSYTGLDWPNIHLSMAAQSSNPPLYLCACPVEGGNGSLQRVFVYDLVRRAWTVLTFPNDISTINLSLIPGLLPVVYTGDHSGGFVRRTFAGDQTDDGSDINWSVVTRSVSGLSPYDRTYWRRMLAKFFGMASGASITTTFFYGPNAPLASTTLTKAIPEVVNLNAFLGWGLDRWGLVQYGSQISETLGGDDAWGSQGWGGFAWTGTAVSFLADTDLEFPIGFKANNVTARIAGSGPGKIRGLEFHGRAAELTRSTVINA